MAIRRAVVAGGPQPDSHNGTMFGNNPEVRYVCEGQADIALSVSYQVPLDASPRDILDALVLAIIAAQPTGFNLHPHDIIVPSIERG